MSALACPGEVALCLGGQMLERKATRALSFDEARERIETAIGPRRAAAGEEQPAAAIEFGLSQNERHVRMALPSADGAGLADLLEAVGKYFAVARFDFHWSSEFAFTASDAPATGET